MDKIDYPCKKCSEKKRMECATGKGGTPQRVAWPVSCKAFDLWWAQERGE